MKAGTRVRVTKKDAEKPREDMPNGYWVEGVLVLDLKVGRRILVDRKIRNGIEIDGVFESSLVVMIQWQNPVEVTTQNSTWLVEEVADVAGTT